MGAASYGPDGAGPWRACLKNTIAAMEGLGARRAKIAAGPRPDHRAMQLRSRYAVPRPLYSLKTARFFPIPRPNATGVSAGGSTCPAISARGWLRRGSRKIADLGRDTFSHVERLPFASQVHAGG